MANTPTPKQPSVRNFGTELGRSGTFIPSGIITLEEYNANLVGQSARKIYDIMRRSDPTVRAALQAVKLPIRSIDFDVEPASDDPADVYAAEFIKHELFDCNVNWNDFLREALTMFDFGFSVFEKTYQLTDFEGKPRIGIQKLGSRKQRTILFWQQQDTTPGIQQQLLGSSDGKTGIISIPRDKLIIFTNDKEGDNYEGLSLLRFCYKPWDMKDKLGLVNAIGLEKMAIGVPILRTPADADENEKRKARASLQAFRANEEAYMELPSDKDGWSIEMLDMKANTTKDVQPALEYLDHQIMLSVLAQFLMLGANKGGSGSRAVSQDHSALFMMSEEAAVKNFVNTVQNELITQLCDLNFTDLPNGYPKLTSARVADDGIETLAMAMNQLATAGLITPGPDIENWLRNSLHAPKLSDEEIANYGQDDGDGDIDAPPVEDKTTPESQTDETAKQAPTVKPQPATDKQAKAAIKAARASRKRLVDIVSTWPL